MDKTHKREKRGRKKKGKSAKDKMVKQQGNNTFVVLTQHEDAFEMFCFDPLMRAAFKDVPFEPSIRGGCNNNKL